MSKRDLALCCTATHMDQLKGNRILKIHYVLALKPLSVWPFVGKNNNNNKKTKTNNNNKTPKQNMDKQSPTTFGT